MTNSRTFALVHDGARRRAHEAITAAPDGYVVRVTEARRRDAQNDKMHAQISDIAKQVPFLGKPADPEDWKRLLVDAFAKCMRDAGTPLHHDGRVVPSLDGERVVQLGIQTAKFRIREASEFIEYLNAFGADKGVVWSEPAA